mgnify:CR=1 FL=1
MKTLSKENLKIVKLMDGRFEMSVDDKMKHNPNAYSNYYLQNLKTNEVALLKDLTLRADGDTAYLVTPSLKNAKNYTESYLLGNWMFQADPGIQAAIYNEQMKQQQANQQVGNQGQALQNQGYINPNAQNPIQNANLNVGDFIYGDNPDLKNFYNNLVQGYNSRGFKTFANGSAPMGVNPVPDIQAREIQLQAERERLEKDKVEFFTIVTDFFNNVKETQKNINNFAQFVNKIVKK